MKKKTSNKNTEDQNLPGYPHYPAEEDILNSQSDTERVPVDIENISRDVNVNTTIGKAGQKSTKHEKITKTTDEDFVEGTDADLDEDDLVALGEVGLSMDDGDDKFLRNREHNMSDSDLDIPGSELDDEDEEIGREDEENNFYSIGGDRD